MRFVRSLSTAFSLAFALTAASALAGEAATTKSVTVSTRGIDLSQPAGAQELYARIRAAAREACSGAAGRSAARQVAWNACRREATERAVASLGDPSVARLHAARGKRSTSAG
jgi:UrcA family protein